MARGPTWGNTIYIAKSGALVSGAPCTLSCWYWSNSFTSDAIPLCIVGASDTNIFDIQIQGSSTPSATCIAETGASGTGWRNSNDGQSAMSTGVWYNVTGVFASATSRLIYRNGVPGTIETTSVIPSSLTQNILGKSTNPNPPYNAARGPVAFSAIWSAALTQNDVSALNACSNPRRVRPASLVSLLYLTGPLVQENDYVSPIAWQYAGGSAPSEDENPRIFW